MRALVFRRAQTCGHAMHLRCAQEQVCGQSRARKLSFRHILMHVGCWERTPAVHETTLLPIIVAWVSAHLTPHDVPLAITVFTAHPLETAPITPLANDVSVQVPGLGCARVRVCVCR